MTAESRDATVAALAAALTDQSDLLARLQFVLEADRLKEVERRSYITAGTRVENTAEHSWHLALMAMVLAPHADENVDLAHVIELVLVHDIVEIDAGDTFVYDEAARVTKAEVEARAADRLFSLLPQDQGVTLRALWDEYEAGATPEARFAYALDRLEPLLLNHATQGAAWRAHGITADRVLGLNSRIALGSGELWDAARGLIEDAVAVGYLDPAPESEPADTAAD